MHKHKNIHINTTLKHQNINQRQITKAWVYEWVEQPNEALTIEWDYETTFLPHLKSYVSNCQEFIDWIDKYAIVDY